VVQQLSRRQREVLEALERGLHITQIAELLDVSENTVKRRCRKVFAKIHVPEAIWKRRYLPRGQA
jgi:DNA-binding NarL/FixJ family response regulator